LDLDKIIETFN